jgi:molybdopterin-guanine dinucleotide biosynthesis protein MobB
MPGKTPILTFIGKSNSGKTTLLTGIIPELKKRGYSVATIKHSHHNVDLDIKGKDSWKHREAGSETVILLSGKKMSCIREFTEEPPLELIRESYIHGADIILAEGFKGSHLPKIWVFRSDTPSSVINKDDSLTAVVSDREVDLGVPWFDINDIAGLADFVENLFLAKRQG